MSIARHHAEWLSLVEQSGPFLSMPVLLKRFNTGLEAHDPERFRTLRMAYEEWEHKWDTPAIHNAWIKHVLGDVLGLSDDVLAEGQAVPQSLAVTIPEHTETLRPDFVVHQPKGGTNRMLIRAYPATQDLEKPVAGRTWKASPSTRMMELLHGTGVRLGLVTNGERWMLVDAPKGETTGFASWYAHLWLDEPITLRAFRSLLSAERFFGVPDGETLEAMLAESAENQQEVTDQLGYQVRNAVEILVQSIDQADQDRGRRLLEGVAEPVLYEAALTVMMRLVFLFCAEERKLLPDDEFYTANYSVSSLGKQLRETSDQHGEEILERRRDAWCRLLATFRAVHGGVSHDRFNLPAYGGHLFDPDRFPFLEGRRQLPSPAGRGAGGEGSWRNTPADPLPVDNRTVLHLLESLQLLEMRVPGGGGAEKRRLSFIALDIEQIGHVYEGLLDHTAKRAPEPVLGLAGTKDKEPEIPLPKLEAEWERGDDQLLAFLNKETGRSPNALWNNLDVEVEPTDANRFQAACGGDHKLWERVRPFAYLVRDDTFGRPVIIPKGSVYVTAGTDRRTTGTHYTPKSLTEPIVQYTLEPLVYEGPAEGKPKEEWRLRSPKELLDLNICDMACGSGAFLVQACRYMSDRLMEAWEIAEERVAGGGWRGTGEEGEQSDGGAALPGVGGVATGDGPGAAMLPGDQTLSKGRDVRDDESDSPGGRLDPRQHRGGPGATGHQGVSELPERGEGIIAGSRDTPGTEPSRGLASQAATGRTAQADGPNQPHAHRSSQGPRKEDITHHPPPATHHAPRITPLGEPSSGKPGEMLIPKDTDERVIYARRIVAGRCLYGVDKNPLACEMAKLSLWLLTLAKDMPFTFLDHAIRCGDSLVGISSTEQLERFSLNGGDTQLEFAHEQIRKRLDATRLLRRQIEERFDSTVEDTEQKALMLRNADEQTRRLAYAADHLIAAHWQPMSEAERERELSDTLRDVEFKFKDLPVTDLDREVDQRLRSVGCGRTLHWPLEFPEVFERGGFDVFVCNPPFMGGSKITGELGEPYRHFVQSRITRGRKGKVDLSAYFLLRGWSLSRRCGCLGLLATNSISQGDNRSVCLEGLLDDGASIYRALSERKWPGLAGVTVATIWSYNGAWRGVYLLDDAPVSTITSFLSPIAEISGEPERLVTNTGDAFRGTEIKGLGFVLEIDEADRLIADDPRNGEVIQPYLTGEDLNSRPDQSASRMVINFRDWPKEKAERYVGCFAIVTGKVKPYRETITKQIHEADYWKFWDKRLECYSHISTMPRVLVRSQVGNIHSMAFYEPTIVFSHKILVFGYSSYTMFAYMQSNVHEVWARQFSGAALRTDMCYSTKRCFDTFVFPNHDNRDDPAAFPTVEEAGAAYYLVRHEMMLDRQEGLTKTYNRFHDPDETAADIQKLRELHGEMDNAVAAAYGWTDLDLGHGFHETKQGIRYTISEPARREVLQRLLKLNHERYEEEVRQGLHEKKGKAKGKATGRPRSRKKKSAAGQRALFDTEDDDGQPAPAKAGKAKAKTETTHQQDGKPLRIEDYETDDVMATFRQAARGRGWHGRGQLLREVAQLWGYQRLGPKVREILKGHLRAAIRRKIIETEGDDVRLCTTTMADYSLEELRTTLCAVMRKGKTYDREEVIHAAATHLGFERVREEVRQPIKSAVNSAIRQGILGYQGNEIWREE